jgi:hypothetical protein
MKTGPTRNLRHELLEILERDGTSTLLNRTRVDAICRYTEIAGRLRKNMGGYDREQRENAETLICECLEKRKQCLRKLFPPGGQPALSLSAGLELDLQPAQVYTSELDPATEEELNRQCVLRQLKNPTW